MRFLKGPVDLPIAPRACAVTNRIDGDFVDFQKYIDSPTPTRLYLKREVVEEAARLCGMVSGQEVERLLNEADERMAAVEAEAEEKVVRKLTETLTGAIAA